MANVETVSLLERHAARRTFPLLARTKVCRNLFGPVDHEELHSEMEKKLQEISERDQSRWNFNFENNTPLPGNYEWEEMSALAMPAFYQDSVHTGNIRTVSPLPSDESGAKTAPTEVVQSSEDGLGRQSEPNQENQSGTINAGSRGRLSGQCRRRKRRSVAESLGNNSQITDFFPKRKRTSDKLAAERSSLTGSSIPVEITPRKRIRW